VIALSAKVLVIAGTLILVSAMVPTRRLIARLPIGSLRGRWYVILAFVSTFLVGYLGYAWVSWNSHEQPVDLLVPVVFLLGACFVWLNSVLSLRTAVAMLRLSLLEQETIADPLTGVFNRRYLDRRLNEEVARARRHGLPLSVLMLDIDHFKEINDRHGHQAGDQVLTLFADQVKRQLREPDIVARYGGDEFLVIAPQTSRQSAIDLAERLRTRLESHRFILHDTHTQNGILEIRLICSIGVASLSDKVPDAVKLVRCADENMYRAKHDGRNKVNADEPSAVKIA
jgi:diguanylate cyclase (GGDEF)-like protein